MQSTNAERSPGLLFRMAQRAFLMWARVSRGMTLGVRGLVLDGEGSVFLVKHSYVRGWHLPGGGVDPGETLLDALAKELREEGNIILEGEPELHGMFLNRQASARDHVAVFVVRRFRQASVRLPDREIVETGFFKLAELPLDTTRGTRRRLAEVLDGQALDAHW